MGEGEELQHVIGDELGFGAAIFTQAAGDVGRVAEQDRFLVQGQARLFVSEVFELAVFA